jgi:hypothetical protein
MDQMILNCNVLSFCKLDCTFIVLVISNFFKPYLQKKYALGQLKTIVIYLKYTAVFKTMGDSFNHILHSNMFSILIV